MEEQMEEQMGEQMESLENYLEQWEKIAEKGESDFWSLNENERIWFNIQTLIMAINNGGLMSFYYDSGADHIVETMEDLKKLELTELLAQIERANSLFPDIRTIQNFEKRNDLMDSWDFTENEKLLYNIEHFAYELSAAAETRLIEFIKTNLLIEN